MSPPQKSMAASHPLHHLRSWHIIPHALLLAGIFLTSCAKQPASKLTIDSMHPFYVRDFGAIPNDGGSDGDAVRKCIQAAVASQQKAVVVFEPGEYRIDASPGAIAMGEWVSLPVRKANNLTLKGAEEGTKLTFTNPSASGIFFDGCNNVGLKNIQIDYDPLPYAFGTTRAVNLKENTFDLELDEGSADFNHPLFQTAKAVWGMVVRPDTIHGTIQYGPVAVESKDFAHVSDRVWRLKVPSLEGAGYPNAIASSEMKSGERYVHMARTYGSAVVIQSCENVLAENVTIFTSPGLSFFPYLSHDVSLVDCHVRLGAGRLISANADGIHARGMRGDLLIDHCSFEGMGDDAINIHSSAILVHKVNTPSEVITSPHTWSVRPGDELVAYDGLTLSEKGRTTVESSWQTEAGIFVRFTKPIDGLRAGQGYAEADRFYNLSEAGGPFVIRKCKFLAHRGRSILVSGANGVIENNQFENNEGWGVDLSFGDSIWAEGPPAHALKITRNIFSGRGGPQPCIMTRSCAPKESRTALNRFFKGLVIADNKFLNITAPAIRLYGVEGAVIENNVITEGVSSSASVASPAVELENSTGIVINGLDIKDKRVKTGVLIGENVEPGENGVMLPPPSITLHIIDQRVVPTTTCP